MVQCTAFCSSDARMYFGAWFHENKREQHEGAHFRFLNSTAVLSMHSRVPFEVDEDDED